jgi:hypothetical protein
LGRDLRFAVVEHAGAPLIVSGGYDGTLRSFKLDGTPGPLYVARAQIVGLRRS